MSRAALAASDNQNSTPGRPPVCPGAVQTSVGATSLTSANIEAEAARLLAGLSPVPGARTIVHRVLGEDAVRVMPRDVLPAPVATYDGGILVREGLSRVSLRWSLCWGVAHHHIERIGADPRDAAHLAAALVMPIGPFRDAVARGDDLWALAAGFWAPVRAVRARRSEVLA